MIPLNINIVSIIVRNIEELPRMLVITNTTSSIIQIFLYRYKNLPLIEILPYICDDRTYKMVKDKILDLENELCRSEYFRKMYVSQLRISSRTLPCMMCHQWIFYENYDEMNADSCDKCGGTLCEPCYEEVNLPSISCNECVNKRMCCLCVDERTRKGEIVKEFRCSNCCHYMSSG